MNASTVKTVTGKVENAGRKPLSVSLKRLLSASTRLIGEILWWVTQGVFAKETATINIEDSGIRFMVTKGTWVKRWGSVPLAAGAVREGLILNPLAVSAAMSELISQQHLKKGKVIASLSGIQSVYRIIELPKMPQKILGEAILGEAKREMSISLEKYDLSWFGISERKDPIQRYFLLGVPKNIMDAEVRCLRQAGIRPRSMIIKPVALTRMISRTEALVIDIEPEICTIAVIAGGVPIVMRSIVMNTGYSSLELAQRVIQEFELTMEYYQATYLDKPLNPETPLFITGGLASETELCQTIAGGAGYNLEPLDRPLHCPPDFPLAQFAVNIGLALNGASTSPKQIARNVQSHITILIFCLVSIALSLSLPDRFSLSA